MQKKRLVKTAKICKPKAEYKSKVANWLVIIHKSRYGYDVYCPALPGCNTQGNTLKEALENAKIAIEEYLQAINPFTLKRTIKDAGFD